MREGGSQILLNCVTLPLKILFHKTNGGSTFDQNQNETKSYFDERCGKIIYKFKKQQTSV